MNSRATIAAAAIAVSLVTASPVASAATNVTISPGDAITIGKKACTVGFFGTNSDHRRLAVTAGHCATGIGQSVRDGDGHRIGRVVAHAADSPTARGPFGATLIALSNSVQKSSDVRKIGVPSVGTDVVQDGSRSGRSRGTVTVNRSGVLRSTASGQPGDSGSPWTNSRTGTLYGITVGGSPRGTYAAPIRAVVQRIRDVFPQWGKGFRVVAAAKKGTPA
ncbi:hypothetical protein [Mycolicibacter arupensis]|uniref:Serine protease n=1 Tax=Mycolicibacter arupensis TaxID=342002 RepID=A0A5C7Y2T1_9MYCO|nr:hypothetical protein [Mycolicibacter arupensis]TXI55931.1 MAG: hypothetical protein E6Q54_11940 [Mycolicibacter arupensis]